MTSSEKQLLLKLFIGIQINAEIRMHLSHSIAWKEAQILKDFDSNHLIEVPFHEESYIGKFLPRSTAKISELKISEEEIRQRLQHYCPNLKQEKFKIHLFSQQFIT